jgi:hypothetical protein
LTHALLLLACEVRARWPAAAAEAAALRLRLGLRTSVRPGEARGVRRGGGGGERGSKEGGAELRACNQEASEALAAVCCCWC